ncbi:MAG: 50S ribosomal protein L11 methyltransferase [Polymorphobacter sp.]
MSADAESWRVTLGCNRIEAELLAYAEELFADMGVPPTILTDEPDPDQPDDWLLHAYFASAPTPAQVARLEAAVASAAPGSATVEYLPPQDWLTLSQAGIEPVVAGRFHVHTGDHAARRRPGQIGIRIDAGLAFGTGQHATTHGCLQVIDRLARQPRQFHDILDLGTGTAVLALAAAKRFRRARIIGSDIDPVSVAVSRRNTQINRERLGRTRGRLEFVAAKGMDAPRLRQRARYDLILANVLAAPLVGMAGAVSAALAPGGMLVLAGLLNCQRQRVVAAYRARGLIVTHRHAVAEWPVLVLRKPAGN